ncbi:metabotropic glutamate receptor 3 [Hydra vulgaris]|uniref:metabotropic glutamate receptor 3 n=1 Tax=Hydra vulgaris TaxID=6087 RepID=UPI000640D875|nr:metabotropic glutamate receptor 3 [Hydra vulgaris]
MYGILIRFALFICILHSTAANDVAHGVGSFLFDGIFSVSDESTKRINYHSGFLMAEAMKFAVEKINNNSDLYGYKLDINAIYDVSSTNTLRNRILSTFLEKIPFIIGPYSSQSTFIAGILTTTFEQPTFSYSARYTDFPLVGNEKILRTVPSNSFQIQAVLDLIKKLKWNYLSVVSSYGYDGEADAEKFILKLGEIGVCLAQRVDIPKYPSQITFDEAVEILDILETNKDKSRQNGLVFFTNNKDSYNLFSAIKRNNKTKRFLIICLSGCANYKENTEGNEEAVEGTLSLDVVQLEIPEFKEFVYRQKPNSLSAEYFNKTWENIFRCSLNPSVFPTCSGNEKLGDIIYRSYIPVYLVMDAIFAVADALKFFINFFCSRSQDWMLLEKHCVVNAADRNDFASKIFDILKLMSYTDGTLEDIYTPYVRINRSVQYNIYQFRLTSDGQYENILVGNWQIKRPFLNESVEETFLYQKQDFWLDHYNETNSNHSELLPVAKCSDECLPGYIAVNHKDLQKAKCCWNCIKCPKNSISVNNNCYACKKTEMLVNNECVNIPEVKSIFSDAGRTLGCFSILMVIGLLLVFFVTIMFIRHNNTRVVRCSGRDLCYMILLGLTMLFVSPMAFMSRPSTTVCIMRGAFPGISFLMCYAPLFLRAARIHRIFIRARMTISRPALISPQSQVFVVLGIVGVQALLASVWFTSKTPGPDFVVSSGGDSITVQCTGDESAVAMFVNLALSAFFVLLCTILAFKTRLFPKNYNEAKFIGVTLYITCVIWSVFLPAYYLTAGKGVYIRECLISILCISIGYVTLFGLFGQKVRLLIWPDNAANCEREMVSFSKISGTILEKSVEKNLISGV